MPGERHRVRHAANLELQVPRLLGCIGCHAVTLQVVLIRLRSQPRSPIESRFVQDGMEWAKSHAPLAAVLHEADRHASMRGLHEQLPQP